MRGYSKLIFLSVCTVCIVGGLSACKQISDKIDQTLGSGLNIDPPVVTPEPAPTASPTPEPSPSPPPPYVKLYIGPDDVEKYVMKFVDDAKIQGINVMPDMDNPKLEIKITSLDAWGASVIGLCETSGTRRRVTFDPDFWDTVSETRREVLAHHELGHCVLYRGHRTAVLSSGAYASIMYPVIMSSSTYLNDYDYYQEELFMWGALASPQARAVPEIVPDIVRDTIHICDHQDVM